MAAPGATPRTITIFRDQTVFHDAPPGIDQMSEAQARRLPTSTGPSSREILSTRRYYQVTNEYGGDNPTSLVTSSPRDTPDGLAERDGFKLAVGSHRWQPVAGNVGPLHVPSSAARAEAYGRHAYGGVVPPDGIATLTAPDGQAADDNAGRPFREAATCARRNSHADRHHRSGAERAPFPGVDTFMEDMARYDRLCRQHGASGASAPDLQQVPRLPANIEPASSRMADLRQRGATRPVYPPSRRRDAARA